jgi:hypothetical protein
MMGRSRAFSKSWVVSCVNLALGVTLASAGRAGEPTSTGAPLPGLESDPPESVAPRSAAVTLRGDQVTLDLAVSATANATALLLNGPRFGWLGAAERYPERQFPELKIRLNGAVIAPQDRFEAMVGGNNVTGLLRAADMDPWAITRNPPLTTAHAHNPQVLNLLRNAGAIAKTGGAADDGNLYTAKWVARRLIAIPVASAADATLQLVYDARPGIRVPSADDRMTNSFERLYCLSEKELRRLQASWDKSPVAISEYDIATGIDGNVPDAVTLSWSASLVASQMRPGVAFWCGPGGKSMSRRGRAEWERAAVDTSGMLHVLMIVQ